VTFTLTATGQSSGRTAQTSFMDAAANIDQGSNGRLTSDLLMIANPVAWQNGDLNANNSHLAEGYSTPFRLVITGLTPGTSHTVKIEWDTRDQSKAGYDYITQYERLDPHTQWIPAHPAETVNPLTGLSGTFGAPVTAAIPTPSTAGTLVPGQPATSFGSLPAAKRVMTLYNGTFPGSGALVYFSQDPLNGNSAKSSMSITFTATASTVVLAWGGHIASNADWLGGAHPGGSPYHMRVLDVDGQGGNQDRSMKAEAAVTCNVFGP